MSGDQQLRQLRNQIDELDAKIQDLINERARIALRIAETKSNSGSNHYYRPEREAAVLRRILKRNTGPLSDEESARLFREIMSACLALESPLQVAYLGPEGTFTQEAALKHFGRSVQVHALGAIDDVFREVESGNARYGVVPVENSTEGVVNHTLDMFLNSSLKICGEVIVRVRHHLLGRGKSLKRAKRIVSHQQSLAQCREWLNANLPGVERAAVSSNAEAARLASKNAQTLAIAGAPAADIHKLNVLARNIEDKTDNTTRFLVIGDNRTQSSGNDKTSLLLSGKNKPGALHRLLQPLAKHEINMTRIESRPSRRAVWEYVFFIDIDGHSDEDRVREVLQELEHEAAFLKLLGSYPKAVL
jgi:chorismate mutase/prephenate dehydratase